VTGAVRHLYVHLPFCGHRCGYCDFVTVVGRRGEHGRYVDALLSELELERAVLSPHLKTVFLGGGTPTFTEPEALRRVLRSLPAAEEVTVEANSETVTPRLAALLREEGVTRVSLGAQSFQPELLDVLERSAQPDDVRRAFYHLRDAGFDNISLDLIYGIPGQSASAVAADIDEALALRPEHLSCYELEAKPGTRFTHAHGAELARQAEAMETYFEDVVDRLTAAGYRWYETANFCRTAEARSPLAPQPRLLARAGLPGHRDRSGLDGRRTPVAKHAAAPRLPRGARKRVAAGARGRGAGRGCPAPRARDARPPAG
jgi:oxygen-independent coproporphyrinogen-3 oxidase